MSTPQTATLPRRVFSFHAHYTPGALPLAMFGLAKLRQHSHTLSLSVRDSKDMEATYPNSTITDPPRLPPETPIFDEDDEYGLPKPTDWFSKLASLQIDLIYNCFTTLSAPIFSLLSAASESYHQAEEAKETVESVVQQVPSTITYGSALLLKKIGFGLLGAAYVCMVLVMVLLLSALFGIGLVNLWVEEPVFVREQLHFDYTEPHPTAVFAFGSADDIYRHKSSYSRKHVRGIPVGHTFYVSLVLLMPESDFNRDIGVFQLSAEQLSVNGDVITRSSQPCMLRFRSLPVRLTRTFLMGVPLLLGISGETQKLTVQIIKNKEGHYPRTQAIRVTLIPRAGTSYIPQLYEAEILMNSQLPWTKQLVRSWKWTFYVWTSLYIYVMFLVLLMIWCRPLFFPMTTISASTAATPAAGDVAEVPSYSSKRESSSAERRQRARGSRAISRDDESEDVQELLRKWQRSRSKRKAIYLQRGDLNLPETVGSSGPSTISITRDDASVAAPEEVGDSESVCL
ncbi:seipin-1 [Pyrus x bretschneideri]|uniref:seipin-1 n=1 Tax=Pyrus x bretschneideri TaxID=225117 RepID=UPI00202FF5FF|nr:seipin-1 [Pyrus x bretschneideri]